MSKKILLPTPDYPPQRGGVARYLAALTHVLGNEVDVHYWPEQMPRRRALVRKIQQLSKGYEQIWTSHIYPIGHALMRTKKPYVVILHGMDFDLARRNLLRAFVAKRILRQAKAVVANSRALAGEIRDFCGVDPLVVYPTPAQTLFTQAQCPDRSMHEQCTLLSVGRLVARKGHIKVLEAMQDLPGVRYVIVGDGPVRSLIAARAAELGLEDRVEIKTHVSDEDLPQMYQQADIFVLPTTKTPYDREGFGIVYLEAGLFCLPVIAVAHPGVDEAVLHETTGLLIKDDVEALKSAIVRLQTDRTLRQQLGKAGFERVTREFTPQKQFAKLKQLL